MANYLFSLEKAISAQNQKTLLAKIREKYPVAKYGGSPKDFPCIAAIRIATEKCTPAQSKAEHMKIQKHLAACLEPHKIRLGASRAIY